MTRRTVLIEQMFRDIATPREIHKLEQIYAKGNKGGATVYMIRIIKDYWDLHIAKKDQAKEQPTNPDRPRDDGFIRVNQGGNSWFEKLV